MSDLKYIVKKGDYLEKIAKEQSNGSWKQLASYNKLSNPDKIFVGQTILIPQKLLKSQPGNLFLKNYTDQLPLNLKHSHLKLRNINQL